MDRPEDVEPNPVNGHVYVMLTNNSKRTAAQVDAANPRPENDRGQVVELIPPDGDHAAGEFGWEMLLIAGDPNKEGSGAMYHPDSQAWFSSPDNCAFDVEGRLWISTDQGSAQRKNNIPDGMYACDVSGDGRAYVKFFYGCPVDAEMCSRSSRPTAARCSWRPSTRARPSSSTFDNPSTRWPDFRRHAAAAVRGRDHQGQRRHHRQLSAAGSRDGAVAAASFSASPPRREPGDLGDEFAQHRVREVRQLARIDHEGAGSDAHVVVEVDREPVLFAQRHDIDVDPGRGRRSRARSGPMPTLSLPLAQILRSCRLAANGAAPMTAMPCSMLAEISVARPGTQGRGCGLAQDRA